jgi:hypothetical protein
MCFVVDIGLCLCFLAHPFGYWKNADLEPNSGIAANGEGVYILSAIPSVLPQMNANVGGFG